MFVQRNSTTSMPHITTSNQSKKLYNYTVKPVSALSSRLVHHYHDALASQHSEHTNHQDPLLHQLIVERDKAKKTIREHSKDFSHQIIQVIKHYNALVEILVKIEVKEGYQVDQVLQHFLVFHKRAFFSYGISIRQFLYLEYDPIAMKNQITKEGFPKSYSLLLGTKGIFTELFYLFDRIVSSLNNKDTYSDHVHQIDIKA